VGDDSKEVRSAKQAAAAVRMCLFSDPLIYAEALIQINRFNMSAVAQRITGTTGRLKSSVKCKNVH
jgi:hypothetical protein